jgi:branched-chain amino acid aminotransferase
MLDPKIKSRSRQHYKLANLEIEKIDRDAIPLLLDDDGFITETTGSNFFCCKGDLVYTPEGRNCLRGISRQFIIDICYRRGYTCMEKNLTLYDAITADEAFVTCTPYCIVPVNSVNGHAYVEVPGSMTSYFTNLWITQLKCDFVQQARKWDV